MKPTRDQTVSYPRGAHVEAIRDIPMSSPWQNYYADPLPRGTKGVVASHTDDGRAWVNFLDCGNDGYGHTFDEPERYIRVSQLGTNPSGTCSDTNCPCHKWSVDGIVEQVTEHEPVARGGEGKHSSLPWRVVVDDTGDPITGGYPSICGPEPLDEMIIHWEGFHHKYWDFHPNKPTQVANAQLIVAAVNQHHSLLAERERLLRLLRPVTSPTSCYCAVMNDEKCWHCEARELLAGHH